MAAAIIPNQKPARFPICSSASFVCPPATPVGGCRPVFDVDMNQLAGPFTLVEHHLLLRGGPVALVEAAQPGAGENPVNSRGRQSDRVADPGRPPPVPGPQVPHLRGGPLRVPGWRPPRPRRPITQPVGVFRQDRSRHLRTVLG